MSKIVDLKKYFNKIMTLKYIYNVLDYDQQVFMPKGSVKGRAEQIALIQELIHELIISHETKTMLEHAEKIPNLELIDAAMLREAKREYKQAVRLPSELVKEIAKTSSLGHQAWETAREKNDFTIFKPLLKRMVELQMEKAEKLGTYPSLYSTLIDLYEPGATHEWLENIFKELKNHLLRILNALESSPDKPNDSILKKHYNKDKQWKFSLEIIKKLNFNFNHGRQDISVHPFTSSLSFIDVRITTRIWENFLPACLFGTIHECGHALYEMNLMEEIHSTNLAMGTSMGMHEAMSRLHENILGRSKEFWTYWYPKLQSYFPEHLKNFPEQKFYRAINVVKPSLIRVEADEITYGLHIILRFELEKMLIEDNLSVDELPEIWNDKMEELLGITPPNDALGVLQDVHWSAGYFGYFPTYSLGNLYASQIYSTILKTHPNLPDMIKKGDYSTLFNYLKENIFQYGKIFPPRELLMRVTGEDLNPKYFVKYLENKFFPIYHV
ncbi:MAG: carboxypeptidase M32 [Promethearchaeota archaeon]